MLLGTFLRVHSKSKEVSYLPWPKFFLWTKLPKNLFLAKFLIFVAATLIYQQSWINVSINYFKSLNKYLPSVRLFFWPFYQVFHQTVWVQATLICWILTNFWWPVARYQDLLKLINNDVWNWVSQIFEILFRFLHPAAMKGRKTLEKFSC